MSVQSVKHARYWRNTLADADLSKGALTQKEADTFLLLPFDDLATGGVPRQLIEKLFAKASESVLTTEIALRPYVYHARREHGRVRDRTPDVIAPIITFATVDRDGLVHNLSDIRIARDILEPLDRGAYTIGTVDALDEYLTRRSSLQTESLHGASGHASKGDGQRPHPVGLNWDACVDECEALLEAVCPGWPGDDYELVDHVLIEKAEGQKGVSMHLLPLYDHIREVGRELPLFERYAGDSSPPTEPCLPESAYFASRLAHSGPSYGLAPAQRTALSHVLAAQHGEIVAVNGPPGTGKTSLLLSVVATLWADAALKGGEPPLIVAASTNNQAVTNILDSFGNDFGTGYGPFAGRWLPKVSSFGAIYPSAKKEKEFTKRYQTAAFFAEVETREFVAEAEAAYLAAAGSALPELAEVTVDATIAALHRRLTGNVARLKAIEEAWLARDAAYLELGDLLGQDRDIALGNLRSAHDEAVWRLKATAALGTSWVRHLAGESIFHLLFGWLPLVARQRRLRARLFLEETWPAELPRLEWNEVDEIEPAITRLCRDAEQVHAIARARLQCAEAAFGQAELCEERCQAAIAELDPERSAREMSLADCDELADRTIRFAIFLLTSHYWEGRWLLDMKAAGGAAQKVESLLDLELQWRARHKLTPCIVSTFYTLPRHLSFSRRSGGDWTNGYLYDRVDLLIVDEAGQGTPEVAGACFALARKALVIGDTLQIEPIWSAQRSTDIGNLVQAGLIPQDGDAAYKAFQATGKASASGSVMKIAQHASRYHQEPELARGLMLTEHRRCFDEIVGYCNSLCYHGKLEPLRGPKAEARPGKGQDGLPAMGYLHVDGICLSTSGGSRHNPTEAETIANWLAANRERLEHSYSLPLSQIVGIVTPFGAQVSAIEEACRASGVQPTGRDVARMTIGTVHALQGAQRPIILFSPVYSKHADGTFIDQSPSMLNVAVSRAMNSFLLFGDMDVMATAPSASPRGQLAALLRAGDDNVLSRWRRPGVGTLRSRARGSSSCRMRPSMMHFWLR